MLLLRGAVRFSLPPWSRFVAGSFDTTFLCSSPAVPVLSFIFSIIPRILLWERKTIVQCKEIERFLVWVMQWWKMITGNKPVTLYPATFFHVGFSGKTRVQLTLGHISSSFSTVTNDVLHQSHWMGQWWDWPFPHFAPHTASFCHFLQWGVILEKQELPQISVFMDWGSTEAEIGQFPCTFIHSLDANHLSSGNRKFVQWLSWCSGGLPLFLRGECAGQINCCEQQQHFT